MPHSNFSLSVIKNNSLIVAEAIVNREKMLLRILLDTEDYTETATTHNLFWSAFNRIRRRMDPSLLFLCNGARKFVYLSPMLRDSEMGLVVYAKQSEVPSGIKSMFFIFDEAPQKEVCTVSEQKAYRRQLFPDVPDEVWDMLVD